MSQSHPHRTPARPQVDYAGPDGKDASAVLLLDSLDEAEGSSAWRLADVRANATVKGRALRCGPQGRRAGEGGRAAGGGQVEAGCGTAGASVGGWARCTPANALF